MWVSILKRWLEREEYVHVAGVEVCVLNWVVWVSLVAWCSQELLQCKRALSLLGARQSLPYLSSHVG